MKQVLATIISNSEVMPETHLIWLDSPQIADEARPGQFVMVRCGEDNEILLRRPLSIHQRDGNKIALLFTVVGKGTTWLSQRPAEDMIDIFGPLGHGFSIHPVSHHLLLVAGGIGIAPLYFLTQEALNQWHSVMLLLGVSTATQLYAKHLLLPEAKFVTTTEDGTAGKKGIITDLLPEFVGWAEQIFACGPLPMYRTMAQMPELKNRQVQVSLEVSMGCGVGICYGCTLKTKGGLKQVCKDGPIFNLEDILWDELNY